MVHIHLIGYRSVNFYILQQQKRFIFHEDYYVLVALQQQARFIFHEDYYVLVALQTHMWCNSILQNFVLFSPCGNILVNRSDWLSLVLIYVALHFSRAVPSLTKWYAIELDLFLSIKWGMVVLANTDWLSP